MTSTSRRAHRALPAAAAALALSGAVLAAAPAEAPGVPPVPARQTAEAPAGASQAELLQRVQGARDVLEGDATATPTAEPEPTASPETSSGTVDPKIIGGKDATIAEASRTARTA
ncbi:hypothetical protein [Streptomyces sp. NPDC006134]|uniref:hypothetical protein n=1 Tax=Streptomyces sp. NPDC006134 TaxID=3154467 RepID=UPI0033D8E308